MNRFLLPPVLALTLAACSWQTPEPGSDATPQTTAVSSETATLAFNNWLDNEFETYLDFYPQAKTRLGIKTGYDQLNDVSIEAMDRVLDWRRGSVAAMQANFDRESLTDQGKISWDLWAFMLQQAE